MLAARFPTSLPEWENHVFSAVLSVTLDLKEESGSHHHAVADSSDPLAGKCKRVLLKEMATECEEAGEKALLTSDSIDAAIIERLNLPFPNNDTAFGYLARSYIRIEDWKKKAAAANASSGDKEAAESHEKSLETLRKSVLSYAGLVLLPTDMLEEKQHQRCQRQAFRLLSQVPGSPEGLPQRFLAAMVAEMDKETLPDAFDPLIVFCIANPRNISLNNCSSPLMFLQNITRVKGLAAVVVNHPQFNPKGVTNGMQLQMAMILGPYLGLTTNGKDPRFSDNPHQRSQAVTEMRNKIAALQESIVRDPPMIIELGAAQDALRPGEGAVMLTNSMPFIVSKKDRVKSVNPTSSLGALKRTKLCEEFFASLIGVVGFLLGSEGDRINYSLCTRFHATRSEMDDLAKELLEKEAEAERKKAMKTAAADDVKVSSSGKATIEQIRVNNSSSSGSNSNGDDAKNDDATSEAPAGTKTKKKKKKKFSLVTEMFFLTMETLQLGYAVQCSGYSATFNLVNLSRYGWAARWMLHMKNQGPEGCRVLAALPEYFASDMANLYILMNRFEPIMLRSQPMEDVMRVVMTLMDSSMLKNASLRGQLPDVLNLALPVASIPSPEHMLVTQQCFTKTLIPRLLGLYVEIEFGENQFYNKFHTRYTISQILKFLWQHPVYHESLRSYDRTKMIRFVNMLCNDAVWLLDEALKHLEDIRVEQKAMSTLEFKRQNSFVRHRREAQFLQLQRMTRSQMNLAHASIQMIGYMSQAYKEPFLSSDLVERVAEMINYYINKFNGPRVISLKVKEPKKFGFRPKILMREIIRIFLVFAEDQAFLKATASDERSYDTSVFAKAAANFERKEVLNDSEMRKFKAVLGKLEGLANEMKNEDELLSDAPQKFLDPIMSTIMKDPVMLPESKVIVDRSVIKRHLLNSTTDPFNRSKLEVADLVDMPDLKKEIEEFIQGRRRDAAAAAAAAAEGKRNKGELGGSSEKKKE
eukprot:jgi/Bigna1/87340/estExt_fgenesh1_pg.C_190095